MTTRFTVPVLLLLASLCVLPARFAAADDKEKKPAATRPKISEEVAPLEAIAPVAKDGYKGVAFLRKPPGKGPFPAVVLVHGGIGQMPSDALKERYALGAWASRYLAAGYVVAMTTWRSRDKDPQTRGSPDDVLATIEYVRKLSYVDPKSIVVNGCSAGGGLALQAASETEVAVIVPEEPALFVFTGVYDKNSPKKGERFTPQDTAPIAADPKKYYTPEHQKRTREKLARINCPIVLVRGDQAPHKFILDILLPELRDLNKNVVVLTYPGEPHCFAFESSPDRTPRPWVAENAFEDVAALVRRHLPTRPSPIDPKLVKQVPFDPVSSGRR
jgi:dienelactone hydrolase